jgi:aryl-alcohol dehydrogenase-like predicted oxidoreductase
VPLVGARRRERLHEALGALDLTLGADDLRRIEDAVPAGAAAGERYDAAQFAALDSER